MIISKGDKLYINGKLWKVKDFYRIKGQTYECYPIEFRRGLFNVMYKILNRDDIKYYKQLTEEYLETAPKKSLVSRILEYFKKDN